MIEPQPHPVGERGRDPLLTLSRAAAEMSRRPDEVPAIAVRTAVELGLDGASFRVLEDDRMTHLSLEAAGSLEDLPESGFRRRAFRRTTDRSVGRD